MSRGLPLLFAVLLAGCTCGTVVVDNRDGGTNGYGQIPTVEQKNWTVSWLNNFRQNVQDRGCSTRPTRRRPSRWSA